jgi:hypothetical protein
MRGQERVTKCHDVEGPKVMKRGALVDRPALCRLDTVYNFEFDGESKTRSSIVLCRAEEARPKASKMGRLVRQSFSPERYSSVCVSKWASACHEGSRRGNGEARDQS